MNIFGNLEEIYAYAGDTTIKWHAVKFPELKSYSISLDGLLGVLGESTKDDFWLPVLCKLKRFRFDCCAAPLPEEALQAYLADLVSSLTKIHTSCQLMYPSAERNLTHLQQRLEALSQVRLAVLLDALQNIPDIRQDGTALLIRESRLIPSVERSLSPFPALRNIMVLNPALLREEQCYQRLIVVGPSRWYPDYVFTAPRAPKILLVMYSWIKDYWKPGNAFLEPIKQRTKKKEYIFNIEEDTTISPADLLPPSIDFQRIALRAKDELHTIGENEYYIDARVFLLEDGWAVFLEADESASAMVIDLEGDHTKPIQRFKIGDINSGMFVLLRTGGGGDYIVPVADQIMGDNAPIAREFQKEWKTLLRKEFKRLGAQKTIKQLIALGSIRANPINLHNWMSERSIKTDDLEDFRAIMRLIGLEKETEYYWEMMRLIDRAHRKAGQQIRRMLLDQVEKCDLNILKRTGRIEFAMPGEQSVSITAFQIKEISPMVIPVAPWRIGDPFAPEE